MKWWEFVALLVTVVGSAVWVTWCIAGELSGVKLSMASDISGVETSVAKSISDFEKSVAEEISGLNASIVEVQSVHVLDMAKIRDRLTAGGWSRPEMQGWIDRLDIEANHGIPSLIR